MRSPRAQDAPILAGRYRVIERLGSGGMASVMLAEDERLGRMVAVKRMPTSSPEDALARFRREARLGASLNHRNVVSIYDSATDEDALLIVMEYVEGKSLKERLRGGALEPDDAAKVLSQVAAALDYAHATGVIHRDVKPSNVLIAPDGTAKLADLGIATAVDATRITSTNDIIGTLTYIAPERLEGAEDDPSADVYSFAAVAFEALSGERAQQGKTPTEIVADGKVRDLRDVWPQAPAAAAQVLREGLARDPGRRPGSAGELAERLSAALGVEAAAPAPAVPLAPAPEPATEVPEKAPGVAEALPPTRSASRQKGGWSRRWTALVAAAAAIAGAVIAVIAFGGGDGDQPPPRVETQVRTVTTSPEPATPEPAPLTGSALGTALNEEGFSLIEAGQYEDAIQVLQRALDAFAGDTGDINYAYALYNLGHALRLAGRPEEAIPILTERLEIPNQTGVVRKELELAQQEAGVISSGGVQPGSGEPGSEESGSGESDSSGPGSSGSPSSGGTDPATEELQGED